MTNNIYVPDETEKLPKGTTHRNFRHESTQEPFKNKILNGTDAVQPNKGFQSVPEHEIPIQVAEIPVERPKPTYDFCGRTVLAVDDVAFNLDLIALFFKKTGARMLFAANGREALEICIANPNIDIVLMDIQMPVMNGLEATLEIRKIKPGLPVIAITAFVHSDDKQRCFDAGCNEFLSKPCSRADMLMTVNNYFLLPVSGNAG